MDSLLLAIPLSEQTERSYWLEWPSIINTILPCGMPGLNSIELPRFVPDFGQVTVDLTPNIAANQCTVLEEPLHCSDVTRAKSAGHPTTFVDHTTKLRLALAHGETWER
jgi:hypothetical protein